MKVSLNWLKEEALFNIELPPIDELVARIGAQLGAVEEVVNLGEKYQGIVIVKVVECMEHPDSDHLHVCKVDDGGKVQDVERDENGLVQVVCGAPNVHADMLAVWLPPGATVPESVGKEPFVLEAREIRGQVSNGMLASQRELALGDNHEGIVDLTGEMAALSDLAIGPGVDFVEAYKLNDYIIDIENKMFTHRPDLFGQLGVAREIAGILGQQFKSPGRYTTLDEAEDLGAEGLTLALENEIPTQVPRFMAVALKDITIKPSPLWLQTLLSRVGVRPINNVVDVTNYMMLLTGQPLHAYDYDKVASGKLGVRFAKPGEELVLLGGKTVELDAADMVITDGVKAIGLAGVMGGAETEVSSETKNIILECATFDMYAIRRTSMRHGLFTDAVTRFNKGQSPLQNPFVLQLAAGHIVGLGAELASKVIDDDHTGGRPSVHPPVPVTTDFINSRLGFSLGGDAIKQLLENVEFTVEAEGEQLTVTAPFWRTDVETREDVVEEVGRLYGYDKLPLELPRRSIKPAAKDPLLELKAKVRTVLAKAGANEVLTYSFVPGELLRKAGQNPEEAFKIGNALSPDLQYYRLSLTPSLLEKVHLNVKAGYDEFALFEIGKGHNLQHAADDDGLPMEFEMLDLVYTASDKAAKPGAAFYEARKFLTNLAADFGLQLEFRPIAAEEAYPVAKPYDHTRSAQVFVRGTDLPLGMVGEYKPGVRKALKLPVHTAGFGIGLLQLMQASKDSGNTYVALPRFPKVTQDMTLKVPATLTYQELFDFAWAELAKVQPPQTLPTVGPLNIYQAADDPAYKHITFRFSLASYERTLTDKEVVKLLDAVAAAANTKFGAERV